MTNTICGHERVVLTRVLRNRFDATMTRFSSLDEERADDDCHDPTKLAEMLAEEGRRLGLVVTIVSEKRKTWRIDDCHLVIHENGFDEFLIEDGDLLTMSIDEWVDCTYLHRLLLKWLQLPDGAREEAERALFGHADPDELLNTIPLREYPAPRQFDSDPDREREP